MRNPGTETISRGTRRKNFYSASDRIGVAERRQTLRRQAVAERKAARAQLVASEAEFEPLDEETFEEGANQHATEQLLVALQLHHEMTDVVNV